MSIVVTSNFTPPASAPSKEGAAPLENKETTPAAAATPAETLEASGAPNENESGTEGDGAAEGQVTEGKKSKNGYKKRIDKLNKRAAEAEQRASYLQGLLDAKKLPDGKKPDEKVEASGVQGLAEGEPDPDKFDSHGSYLKELTKWQIAENDKAKQVKAEAQKQTTEEQKVTERLKTSIESVKAAHKDWDDVVTDEVEVTPELGRAIRASDDPGLLMYHLCKDKESHAKIVALSGDALVRAVGRFEAKLEPIQAKPAPSEERKTSNAPPPISPVGNKGTGAGKKSITDPNLSQREFEALVREQSKARGSSW